jgi:Rha family phage regulatory protein
MSNETTQVVYPVVELVEDQLITTSLNIAEVFGKPHGHVLRSIRDLDSPKEFNESNFGLIKYVDAQGRKKPMYNITRDGFALLVMGYTGERAMQFKLAYIEAFNRMAVAISSRRLLSPPADHPDQAIPDEIWQKIKAAGKTVKIGYRVKLLHAACQMSRIDETIQPTRESILLDYAELCNNICLDPQGQSFESAIFQDFLDECCIFDPNATVVASTIYSRFSGWYQRSVGGPPPTGTWFGKTLSREKLRKAKSNGSIVYRGIGLKDRDEGKE